MQSQNMYSEKLSEVDLKVENDNVSKSELVWYVFWNTRLMVKLPVLFLESGTSNLKARLDHAQFRSGSRKILRPQEHI
jgi:hypothetical protein